jgi:RNA 2',3'-cyclic 3'-phosphodiesterase
MSNSRRLFFALWPTDEFRADLVLATQNIACDSGGRVIPPENLHVTLLFLGQVPNARFDAVQQAADALTHAPAFELSFDRAEVWGRANLLCLTTSTTPPAAAALADKLGHSLRDERAEASEREFRPHITLARDLPRRRRPEPMQPLLMKVNDFVLVDSRQGPSGSQYEVLRRWPLVC